MKILCAWFTVLLLCRQWLTASGLDHRVNYDDGSGDDECFDETDCDYREYLDEIYRSRSAAIVSQSAIRLSRDKESSRILCGICFPDDSARDLKLHHSVSTTATNAIHINVKLTKRTRDPLGTHIVEEINLPYITVSSDEMDEEYMYALNFGSDMMLRRRLEYDTNLSVSRMRYWPTSGISCLFRGLLVNPTGDGQWESHDYHLYGPYTQEGYSDETECLFSNITLNEEPLQDEGPRLSVSVTTIVLLSVLALTM
uniref:Uncharacterized protein n=1 Tax=Penaeus semisulcatus majanivirus TaxID=2984274 RepID=A0A9C7BLX6_9VIRU|nr:MAG: hypothetical protein [Penaeus semisulcatus majanivirus]